MKKIGMILIMMSTLFLFMAVAVWAQPGMGPGGGGPRVHYGTMWDAKTVATMKGEVVSVDKYIPGKGGTAYGLRLTLKTDKETLPVILGPAWYIEQQHFIIAPKDHVEIKVSQLSIEGQPTFIAQEVKKGDVLLRLRNDQGAPLWR